jgi:uncharacterized membrane protein (UPF0127 family)
MSQRIVLQSIIAAGAIVFLAFFNFSGCFNRAPSSDLPTTKMQIGEKHFELEIADTPGKRNTGLMRRDSMPADHGMIFVFPEPDTHSFWMQNTRIPLDIVFVDANGRIASIQQMKPYDLTSVNPPVAIKYAIELNVGAAAKAGAKLGDKLVIPEVAKSAKQ